MKLHLSVSSRWFHQPGMCFKNREKIEIERRKLGWLASAVLAVAVAVTATTGASDWPTFRGNGMRNGYTEESLPANLALCWSYKPIHPPVPAWPGRDTRMPFDRAFHPKKGNRTADGRR